MGIANLKDDIELFKTKISLWKLRHIIVESLSLHPFMKVVERHIIEEISKQNPGEANWDASGDNDQFVFEMITDAEMQAMNPLDRLEAEEKMSFSRLSKESQDSYMIDISMIDSILSS